MTDEDAANGGSTEPMTEDWRRRALAAEAKADELQNKLGTVNGVLTETQAALSGAARTHAIDLELMRADAIDLDAARLLAESTIAKMAMPDIPQAVAALKSGKPFLFRARKGPLSGMSPTAKQKCDGLAEVAEQARATGDRRALLRYLRAKRND